MKVVGLTGGIGSGKTTVAGYFQKLGVPIYIADEKAREITDTSSTIRQGIIAAFGEELYSHGELDRKSLALIVFKDQEKLELLNGIIHPEVEKHFEAWKKEQSSHYVVYEAAILFEKGGYKKCDFNILVTAECEERIKRLIKRDGSSRQEILDRMASQWSDKEKRRLADLEIINMNPMNVEAQVREFHRKFSE